MGSASCCSKKSVEQMRQESEIQHSRATEKQEDDSDDENQSEESDEADSDSENDVYREEPINQIIPNKFKKVSAKQEKVSNQKTPARRENPFLESLKMDKLGHPFSYQMGEQLDKKGQLFEAIDSNFGYLLVCRIYPHSLLKTVHFDVEKISKLIGLQHQIQQMVKIRKFVKVENNDMKLFMEYISGQSLKDIRLSFGEFCVDSENTLIIFTKQLMKILNHIHSLDIVHGNIKSSTILLDTQKNYLKLSDFNIFQLNAQNISKFTNKYSAPELFRGEVPTEASDIWSVGLVILEMLLGQFPIMNTNKEELKLEDIRKNYLANNFFKVPRNISKKLYKFFILSLNPAAADRATADYLYQIFDQDDSASYEPQMSYFASLTHGVTFSQVESFNNYSQGKSIKSFKEVRKSRDSNSNQSELEEITEEDANNNVSNNQQALFEAKKKKMKSINCLSIKQPGDTSFSEVSGASNKIKKYTTDANINLQFDSPESQKSELNLQKTLIPQQKGHILNERILTNQNLSSFLRLSDAKTFQSKIFSQASQLQSQPNNRELVLTQESQSDNFYSTDRRRQIEDLEKQILMDLGGL